MKAPFAIESDPQRLAQVLGMADIAPLAQGRTVTLDPVLEVTFVVSSAPGEVRLGRSALEGGPALRIVLRHALELSRQLEICASDPILCGLAAARSAALFASLERSARASDRCAAYDPAFASDLAPDLAQINALWPLIAHHQPEVTGQASSATAALLSVIWPLLGPAEFLMGTGGDGRLMLDPDTGLNAYGCSSRPRPWAVTFASSTASSISERGYAAAEAARLRLLRDAIDDGGESSERALTEHVRRSLVACYQLSPDTRIVLVPSGTDGELCAVAVAHLGDPAAPLTNVLVAPEETGTGVPLAATGRHFATRTARGAEVSPGQLIAGFPPDIDLATVAARTEHGQPRPASEVNAECEAKLAAALAGGRRVLVHLMDQSKTGLLAPSPDWISERLGAAGAGGRTTTGVDVVVDACQARLSPASVRGYLGRGFMVLVTGLKFFTGPPYAGALLLPAALASRLDVPAALPAGLAQYCSRFDWPETPSISSWPKGRSNVGLALRWEAALAEMRAFLAVELDAVKEVLALFARRLRSAIRENPDLQLHEVPELARSEHPEGWDALPTIFTFSILASAAPELPRSPLPPDEARQIYLWLNSDVSACLPERASDTERALAARLFHIGQPVAIAAAPGKRTGGLRISAGARLVSGEPSLLAAYAGLGPMARIEREIADAVATLAKVSLILRYRDAIRALDPRPKYEATYEARHETRHQAE